MMACRNARSLPRHIPADFPRLKATAPQLLVRADSRSPGSNSADRLKPLFERVGPIPVVGGQASTIARFADAGTCILRAAANDGALSTSADIVVTIISGSSK